MVLTNIFKLGDLGAPDFLKLFHLRVLVYVCVSVSKGVINKSRERHL